MHLDEKISSGLAKQFLNWYEEERYIALQTTRRTTANIKKYFDRYCLHSKNLYTNKFISTRGNHPFFSFIFFKSEKYKEDEYEERILIPYCEYWGFHKTDEDVQDFDLGFFVTEHAIKRIYQRSELITIENARDNFLLIVNEMKYLSLWVNLWLSYFHILEIRMESLKIPFKNSTLEKVRPIIPSPRGLFLCDFELNSKTHVRELTKYSNSVRINSYIGDQDLKKNQRVFRDELLKISIPFKDSILCFENNQNDFPEIFRDQIITEKLYLTYKTYSIIDSFITSLDDSIMDFSITSMFDEYFNDKGIKEISPILDKKITQNYDSFLRYTLAKKITGDLIKTIN